MPTGSKSIHNSYRMLHRPGAPHDFSITDTNIQTQSVGLLVGWLASCLAGWLDGWQGRGGRAGRGRGGNNRFVPQSINNRIRATENNINLLINAISWLIGGH